MTPVFVSSCQLPSNYEDDQVNHRNMLRQNVLPTKVLQYVRYFYNNCISVTMTVSFLPRGEPVEEVGDGAEAARRI